MQTDAPEKIGRSTCLEFGRTRDVLCSLDLKNTDPETTGVLLGTRYRIFALSLIEPGGHFCYTVSRCDAAKSRSPWDGLFLCLWLRVQTPKRPWPRPVPGEWERRSRGRFCCDACRSCRQFSTRKCRRVAPPPLPAGPAGRAGASVPSPARPPVRRGESPAGPWRFRR